MNHEGQFSAVLTTGIYCRDGCGGRPLPANVVRFAYAAAAEAAGFRACLRCRPYRGAEPAGWVADPEVVCRAVRLILDGALDRDGSEDRLAARLGVSARHLRRLFREHVGATPDQVARSRRAHFARRLLDDTDLSITDVAFAAGFGSVRQLNRVAAEVFRASPTELRARRRRTDRLVADGGLVLRLPFRPPLAWDDLLAFLAPRAVPGVESVGDDRYRRTIDVDGDPGVVEVERGGADHLLLRAHLPHWGGLIHVVQRLRRLFDLDADPGAVANGLGRDPALAPSLRARPGLRTPGVWDGFECGVRAILGQQVSVRGATTLAGRLVSRLGRPVPGVGALRLTHLFPTASAVAAAPLLDIGIPGARADAVRGFAAAVAAGDLDLDRSGIAEHLTEQLTRLRGVGPWTAQYMALRLGHADAFPAGDLWLRRALRTNGSVPTASEVERRAEPWRPWRSYAAMHLWSSITNVGEVPTSGR